MLHWSAEVNIPQHINTGIEFQVISVLGSEETLTVLAHGSCHTADDNWLLISGIAFINIKRKQEEGGRLFMQIKSSPPNIDTPYFEGQVRRTRLFITRIYGRFEPPNGI